jgi:sugar/nucleoside kinase (ribokinase family)
MRVIVAGNLVLDILAWPVEKLIWDGTIWVEQLRRSVGGNGANTAYTLAKLGMETALFGSVGNDAEGQEILTLLREVGVNVEGVSTLPLPTPTTLGMVQRRGARAFVHRPGASKEALQTPLEPAGAKHFHLANPFGVPALRTLAPENLRRAQAAGMSTSLDTGWDSRNQWGEVILPCLSHLDILFANEDEAKRITGARSWRTAVAALRQVKTLVLKRGKKGAVIFGDGYEAAVPGYEVEAIDSTGAGDVFAGAYLSAWLKGMSASEAARFANAAAALCVQQLGSVTGLRTFREILTWQKDQVLKSSSSPPA